MATKVKDEFNGGTTTIERKIVGAAIVNNMTLNTDYREHTTKISKDELKRQDVSGTIGRKGDNAVHDDLINAFKKLNVHLALIAEMIELPKSIREMDAEDVEWDEEKIVAMAKDFMVREFLVSGSGDSEAIVLVGEKKLRTTKILKLKAPAVKLIDSDYKYINQLSEIIEECKYEAIEYLNGKMAPPMQTEMELELEGEEKK